MNNSFVTDPGADSISDAAARWVARRDAGLSAAEQAEFERWLALDPRHASALEHYTRTWSILDRPRRAGMTGAVLGGLRANVKRKRRRLQAAGVGLALVIIAAFGWRGQPRVEPVAVTAPASAILLRPETRTLPDGSIAELKAGTEITVSFDAALRRVVLLRGEAHFNVVSNATRPFVVEARAVQVRAVGTAFAVQLGAAQIEVLVTEGKVAVTNPGAAHSPASASRTPLASPTTVEAGHRLVVNLEATPVAPTPPTAQLMTTVELNERLAWRSPRLEFSSTPLAEAIALMNRSAVTRAGEAKLRIVIDPASPGLAEEPVTGLFRADNAEAFVHVLELSLGVTAERRGEREVVLRKAK